MSRLTRNLVTGAAAVVGAVVTYDPRLRRVVLRGGDLAARRIQQVGGEWQGVRYRLSGRHPTTEVDDATLADRVRSSLGPLVKELDLPHVHVMCQDHVVLLHGEVAALSDAKAIESAVRRDPAVLGVESYLHIGLLRSDTRPSHGHVRASEQHRRLLAAVTRAGVAPEHAAEVVRAVLSTFVGSLPHGEREHVLAHLPADVRILAAAPRRHGREGEPRTVAGLVDVVAAVPGGIPRERSLPVVRAVLGELRAMVPEERADVAAVLPAEVRDLWEAPRRDSPAPGRAGRP